MGYQVTLQPSGRSFEVASEERILAKGLKSGINMPYGCRMGTCCSCRGRILSGTVDLGDAHPAYLTAAQREEGYALLCQATARSDVVIEVDELPDLADPVTSPAIVKRVERLASDVVLLHVRLPLHLNLRFSAGQYVDMLFEGGVRRSYSIANAPRPEGVIDFEFHIRHMPGGLFTDRLFAGMKAREKIEFEGPLGTFFLREADTPIVFLASGTGYAPIRSILLDALPKRTGRKMTLYWGARSLADIYLREEAEALARDYPDDLTFIPVLSDPKPEDDWTGRTGLVHQAVMADLPDMGGIQVYACGVPIMVDTARHDFVADCNLPEAAFFADSFVSRADALVAEPEPI